MDGQQKRELTYPQMEWAELGSPRAMARMCVYLYQVKPRSVELVVDEMLSIRSEIDAWRRKKEAQEANAAYNAMLYRGFPGKE